MPIAVFPEKSDNFDEKTLVLLSVPEEEVRTPNVLSWPGEYNEGGISVYGIGQMEGQEVSYVVEVDGVRCAFLASPLQDWTDHQIEMVGEIDVLSLPAENAKIAQKLIDEFDPRVIILLPTSDKEAYAAITKLIGAKGEAVSEYKLKSSLPAEGREVVVMKK